MWLLVCLRISVHLLSFQILVSPFLSPNRTALFPLEVLRLNRFLGSAHEVRGTKPVS